MTVKLVNDIVKTPTSTVIQIIIGNVVTLIVGVTMYNVLLSRDNKV